MKSRPSFFNRAPDELPRGTLLLAAAREPNVVCAVFDGVSRGLRVFVAEHVFLKRMTCLSRLSAVLHEREDWFFRFLLFLLFAMGHFEWRPRALPRNDRKGQGRTHSMRTQTRSGRVEFHQGRSVGRSVGAVARVVLMTWDIALLSVSTSASSRRLCFRVRVSM